jgi:preprotein translocase subunit SecE
MDLLTVIEIGENLKEVLIALAVCAVCAIFFWGVNKI